ncbi:DUF4253 domain-containing protein [Spirillospora sp. NPDC048911]|uniref:DUF4253 domain-containing protein n=1 Tax=Spirillospora sp. NPDC048911 TaxID=3364527 RepID=UPI0037165B3F
MIGGISGRLAACGVGVPELRPLPGAVTVAGFASGGAEALAWWYRLRAVHGHTGLWPVLTDGVALPGGDPAARLAEAAELDGAEVLNPSGDTYELLDDMPWPDEPHRLDGFGFPYLRDGGPAPVTVALVEAEHGWQVPALLNYGGFNDCPPPAVHGAVLRHWHEHYGAELVCLERSALELLLSRPPQTRAEALAFAWEYTAYCADGADLYQAEELPELAGSLLNAEVVRFWWD